MPVKRKFKNEFRKQLRMAIAAAIGFIIAFSWKDSIILLSKDWISILELFFNTNLISFASSVLITIFGVLLIIISSKLLD